MLKALLLHYIRSLTMSFVVFGNFSYHNSYVILTIITFVLSSHVNSLRPSDSQSYDEALQSTRDEYNKRGVGDRDNDNKKSFDRESVLEEIRVEQFLRAIKYNGLQGNPNADATPFYSKNITFL